MKKLSIILIIIGVLVGVSPLVGQAYTKYNENRMMAEWMDSVDTETIDEAVELDPEVGYSQLQEAFAPEGNVGEAAEDGIADGAAEEADGITDGVSGGVADGVTAETGTSEQDRTVITAANQPEATAEPKKQAVKQTVLGIIQIKKIKVKAPIVEGVRASNLAAAVGHIPGTAALGQPGNSALAGHRSYTFGKFFNRLDELVEGDEIIITTKKEELKYKVFNTVIVTPDDVSVLRGSKDDSIITLITCTPIYKATHRLIVQARLESSTLKTE